MTMGMEVKSCTMRMHKFIRVICVKNCHQFHTKRTRSKYENDDSVALYSRSIKRKIPSQKLYKKNVTSLNREKMVWSNQDLPSNILGSIWQSRKISMIMDVIPNTIRKQLKPPKISSASEYLQPAKKHPFLTQLLFKQLIK